MHACFNRSVSFTLSIDVLGIQSGVVGLFSWGNFGDVSDRLVGHPESVDAMVPLNQDVVLTGSIDGMIRIVGVLPNKVSLRA